MRTRTMQNMSFYLQRWEIVGTKAIHQDHWSFYLYLGKCHLLYNLHSLQKVIHRRNRGTTRRLIPRTPSRRRERRKDASKLVARHFNLPNHSKQPAYGSLRPLPTSRKRGKPQNSRTKIYFWNRHSSTLIQLICSAVLIQLICSAVFHVTRHKPIAYLWYV